MTTTTGRTRVRLELIGRSVVFVLLVLWIVGGPFSRQVLGMRTKYLRPWVMFRGRGVGFVEARFFHRQPNGTLYELDRFKLLNFPVRHKAPQWLRLIKKSSTTRAIAVKLCARLGPSGDVRAYSRRATSKGWVVQDDGSTRYCEVSRSRKRPRGKKR